MSEAGKAYVGRNAQAAEVGEAVTGYSKVILWLDGESCFTAGDDTGRVLEAKCPWGTQAMANAQGSW